MKAHDGFIKDNEGYNFDKFGMNVKVIDVLYSYCVSQEDACICMIV